MRGRAESGRDLLALEIGDAFDVRRLAHDHVLGGTDIVDDPDELDTAGSG